MYFQVLNISGKSNPESCIKVTVATLKPVHQYGMALEGNYDSHIMLKFIYDMAAIVGWLICVPKRRIEDLSSSVIPL